MKTFNEGPDDKYPTFTLCFKGHEFHWYRHESIFNSYGLDTFQYERMLKGDTAMKDELNKTSKEYVKTPVVLNDGTNVNFDQHHLKVTDFLRGLQYNTQEVSNNVQYFSPKDDPKEL